MAELEHINITVPDPKATAAVLCDLFGWHVRWEGAAIGDGYTVHVGSERSYLALYTPGHPAKRSGSSYRTIGGMNHIGVRVDDLEVAEARVTAAGFLPHTHADYEPGRRFYFDDANGVEIEVVAYS